MNVSKLITRCGFLAGLSVILAGCTGLQIGELTADQAVIADTFNRKPLNAANIESTIQNCMPGVRVVFNVEQWQNQPFGSISITSAKGVHIFFIATKTQGVCIRETKGGFPVLPVEAIEFRTFFTDIPRAEQQQWFRQVAKSIATSGNAELAVTMGNGATTILTYNIVIGQKGQLRVAQRFVAAGQSLGVVNPQAINIVTAAVSGMSITQRPTAAGLAGRDDPEGTQMSIFSDAKFRGAIDPLVAPGVFTPSAPVRTERSLLTDLPK